MNRKEKTNVKAKKLGIYTQHCSPHTSHISSLKTHFSHPHSHYSGITLVALVVTIVVLLILAGVTITALLGDDGIIKKAQNAADATNSAVQNEVTGMNILSDKMNNILSGMGGSGTTPGGDDEPEMPDNWNPSKVQAVESDNGKVVPVPIGFTKSTVKGEGSVDTGFVIKQGSNGSLTSGVNEFVWVPVEDPTEMFGIDKSGNSLGKIYDFGTSSAPNNPPKPLNWTEVDGIMEYDDTSSSMGNNEPNIVSNYDGMDAKSDSSQFVATIGDVTQEEFKIQLQQEFEDMRESVERYGGFYIGRYETGNINKNIAVVQKGNEDLR